MAEPGLNLVKVPLRVEQLLQVARHRGLSLRTLDDGYFAHCILKEIWQDQAPAPFVLRGRGRVIDAWGYTDADAAQLIAHARDFADPSLLSVIEDPSAIASKPMPCFAAGRRVGFLLRACPVVRLSKGRADHRAGAEVDASWPSASRSARRSPFRARRSTGAGSTRG